MKPVVMLVGHGAVSGKGVTVDYGKHDVMIPIPNKEPFSLSSHNMIVKRLTEASNGSEIKKEVEFLVGLPTTIRVTSSNYQDIKLTSESTFGIGTSKERVEIRKQLLEAEEKSLSSQKAWELLEYKISPAENILTTKFSFLPIKNTDFTTFTLMHHAFVDSNASTLSVHLNKRVILEQVDGLQESKMNKSLLSENNFIYITPQAGLAGDSSIMLSGFFTGVAKLTILAASYNISSSTFPISKKTKAPGKSIEMVFLEDFRAHKNFIAFKNGFEQSHMNTEWFEFNLPEDCHVIIGACGGEDSSF